LKEGGRIPGPPGKSVWGGPQPSRVRPGGETALDCSDPPLTTRYKLQIGLLYAYRLAPWPQPLHGLSFAGPSALPLAAASTSTSLKQQPPSNNNQFSATTNTTNSKNSAVSPVG